jgi:hypothetical protein
LQVLPDRKGKTLDPNSFMAQGYRIMAEEAKYRPAAPSDGLGNITVDLDELDLVAESRAYAARWDHSEASGNFFIGVCDYTTRQTTMFAVEAARLMCAGSGTATHARKLLELALEDIKALESLERRSTS